MDTAAREVSWETERAITALMHRAARLADEQRYREWVELFTPEAEYSVITRENLADKGLYLLCDQGIDAIKERAAYLEGVWQAPRGRTLHTVSNVELESAGAEAVEGRSYFVVYRTGELEHSKLHACGEYVDRFVQDDQGRWLFTSRRVIIDTELLPSEFTELL